MKVLWLVPKLDTPSARWRVLQLIPHLEKAGVKCRVEELPAGVLGKLGAAKHALGFDVVVLQKRLLPRLISGRLRKFAKRLIFEFDDAVTLKKTAEGVHASGTRERRFRRAVEDADAVIAANEQLAELARRLSKDPSRVHVLPSAIDLDRWPARGAREDGPVVIGWAGTPGMLAQLDVVKQPLARLCRRHEGLKLRILCDEAIPLEGVTVEHRKFSPDTEVADLESFDIAIAPQVEDVWTRSKVPAKVLAYFAACVPTVASDVDAYRAYVKDGVNGYLAGTLTEWEEKLEALVADAALRERISKAGRATAERDFSIASVVPKYVELFDRLSKMP